MSRTRLTRIPGLAGLLLAVPVMTGIALAQAPARTAGDVTFTKDIAPILQRSCQDCHRPDSVAPMSLLTYEDARPFARAMKTRMNGSMALAAGPTSSSKTASRLMQVRPSSQRPMFLKSYGRCAGVRCLMTLICAQLIPSIKFDLMTGMCSVTRPIITLCVLKLPV